MKRRHRHIKRSKPATPASGSAVKICRCIRTVASHKCATFEVCDHISGHRRLHSFADHQAVLRAAQRLARLLAHGEATAAALSGREAACFGRCLELLRRTGDGPELACARCAEVVEVLVNGSLMALAARF